MANRILGGCSLLLGLACFGVLCVWLIRLAAVGGGIDEAVEMISSLGWVTAAFVALCLIVGTVLLFAGITLLSREER
jgi:hypothetical protein